MENTAEKQPVQHTAKDEFADLMRGVGGAALIGVPLVYTMEMWDFASFVSYRSLLLYLGLAFVLSIGYNYLSGFRPQASFWRSVADAVESLTIGFVLALFLLWLLGLIDAETPLTDALCKAAFEAIPLSLGVSVANTQFSGNRETGGDEQSPTPSDRRQRDLLDIGIAFAGSVLFAANIAPTEEILRIAVSVSVLKLLLLVAVSLLLSYTILFVASFTGREERTTTNGLLQQPIVETVVAYAVALIVAYVMVIGLHGLSLRESPFTTLAATVTLAFPAAIGGAAGRLIA